MVFKDLDEPIIEDGPLNIYFYFYKQEEQKLNKSFLYLFIYKFTVLIDIILEKIKTNLTIKSHLD